VPQLGGGSTTQINFTDNPDPLTITALTATPQMVRLRATFSLRVTVEEVKQGASFRYQGLPYPCESVNASSLNCTPIEVGTFGIEAWVTDGAGESAFANTTVIVSNSSGGSAPGNSTSAPGSWELIAAGVAALTVGALAVVAVRRRRPS
jgi:hypothetical protein